jgi:hypothetical protein
MSFTFLELVTPLRLEILEAVQRQVFSIVVETVVLQAAAAAAAAAA